MLSTDPKLANSGLKFLPQSSSGSPNQELLPLTAKVNDKDALEIGGCDVTTLVKQFGSPLYILDEFSLRTAAAQYRDSFKKYYPGAAKVIYASKAWNCLAVCRIVDSEGLGIDVASGGELYTALQAGISGDNIYFHGNNKSAAELAMAIEHQCTIMVDNWQELKTLVELGRDRASFEAIKIMLRLTPGIECHTHEYIRTGQIDSKFGFGLDSLEAVFEFVSQNKELDLQGLHAHIGSQIFELQPHQDLAGVLMDWAIAAQKYDLSIKTINVGGGLGICYTETDDPPSIEDWVKTVAEAIAAACQSRNLELPELIAEPGRSLIGTACVTAYTVGGTKTVPGIRNYISIDGGMSDNPRPITYESVYRAVVANKMSAPLENKVTIAGKHCESGDILIQDGLLPRVESGDIIVIMGTGAYNYSMASNYNRLTRPAAVLVNRGEANLILQRETYDDLIRQDLLPQRLLNLPQS
ncbi:MAG: diaminopimelate decarboxylase [Prochloraceae cyanobacterium]|nr:diaminopimelate decarboxylase [Prochloraceae cyanobacterium]